ncbi:uncharacterized protein [Euwallacea similis]|uniref:uncharacterized protein isoform X1 n=1 Tax=Euwallacea similis TaxID=1736056 RepID=UPI00344D3A99
MKTNCANFPITIALLMLSFIPWPGPTIFKIPCRKDNARLVRKIVQSKWIPVLNKYKVILPLDCPFHPKRDIFGPQEAMKKQHRPSQWTCGICGKSFFEEKFLDLHFDNRHKDHINMAEDAVCLADYCDIMRCDVINIVELKSMSSNQKNTDIEVWREASSYSKALTAPGLRGVTKYTMKNGNFAKFRRGKEQSEEWCESAVAPKAAKTKDSSASAKDLHQQNSSSNNVCQTDLVDSAFPSHNELQQRLNNIRKLKANCKPEELQKIKTKCEILVRDCIAGLLVQLSDNDFKDIEDELNRSVCWYLTCDRYWEDSQSDLRSFPWGLLCMIVMVLSLGVCLCYYIVWVVFDVFSADDMSVTSASITDRSTPSPARLLRSDASTDGHQLYSEDYIGVEKDSDYIYVTYPPDLKRRLLESCYNRTTRL